MVIEDDAAIAASLVAILTADGHHVEQHDQGLAALAAARVNPPDLVLLDLGLPDVDGVQVCRALRQLDAPPSIVMLTARTDEIDVVLGLDAGADDYLTKPFRLAELQARVRAHLRRRESTPRGPLHCGALTVDLAARRAWWSRHELALRPKEFDLLALLATDAGCVLTRERIMSEVWDENWFGSTKTLDQHVLWLRQKLAAAGAPDLLTTLRGVGYRLDVA